MDLVNIIIAIAMASTGLYSISPWREIVPESIFGGALFNPPAIFAFGAFYLVVALVFLVGHFKDNQSVSRAGLMGMFVGLLFVTFLRLIVLGAVPTTWVFSLALAVVVSVSYLHSKLNEPTLRV